MSASTVLMRALFAACLVLGATARAADYEPADQGQYPKAADQRLLPDKFLRGYDPVTVFFTTDVAPKAGPADDGAKRLSIAPAWPGAWTWVDRRTLQFRPAEPWPALARFSVEGDGQRRVLTTMMSAPVAMSPEPDSTDLRPFRTISLTFPQALPLEALRQMLRLEVRDAPGLADSPRRLVKDFALAPLPRASQSEPARYAVTLPEDVAEGRQLHVNVSLALGDEGKVLWTARLSTRDPFRLLRITCNSASFELQGGATSPKDLALACGSEGQAPTLVFNANVRDLTPSDLHRLVRLEPAVPNLEFNTWGTRVALRGRFVPDTLYRLQLGDAPIRDDAGRTLVPPGKAEVYFHLGWKTPFLRWNHRGTALVEANGPRMLPLIGYGDTRADVRIHRVDPTHTGLWPFPADPVVIAEESAPPFPGEEPRRPVHELEGRGRDVEQHLRLLGTPLVSKLVDLPLEKKSGSTEFGLDLGALLDPVVGKNRPGTYLVGLRRLTGPAERTWLRVEITNLSVTSVETRDRAELVVRRIDDAGPVAGARIVIDAMRRVDRKLEPSEKRSEVPDQLVLTTDATGRATLPTQAKWSRINRTIVQLGEDVLVFGDGETLPSFADNHWAGSAAWLSWVTRTPPAPQNDALLGFLVTERAIYRPGEAVHMKGWIRWRRAGELQSPGPGTDYALQVIGPDGQTRALDTKTSALGGFNADFLEADAPTGEYVARLVRKKPAEVITERSFKIEAYRLPTFEVQLTGPEVARLDAPFQVKAVARYYSGGTVANQPVKWTVTRRPAWHVPKGREGFLFASSTQFARPSAARTPDTTNEDATLDENGSDDVSVNPALDLDGSPRTYRFTATVTGPDDQQVTAFHDVKALPPFTIGLKLERYRESATEIVPEIIAVGIDDKLLAGQDVLVRLYRRVWHSHLRETNFATGQAKYVTDQEDQKIQELTIRTDTKAVAPKLPITESGVFVVELVSRDKLGRVQTLSADLYVGGRTPMSWKKSREGVFELAPDKAKYAPGDTARVVIQSPFQVAKALVVVEEPGGNTYTWHDVVGGKAVHEVRIAPQHVPNLPMHVVLMRGRIGEGTTDDSRYRPQTVASSIDLEIEPVKNKVALEVKHAESVRPGTKTDLTLTLKDEKGAPLSGEVTVWLVDEAVLALAKEGPLDPLTRFIVRNARTSGLHDSRNTLLGRLLEQDETPGGDGDGDDDVLNGKLVVRRNFQTVPYWAATLEVGKDGKLVVPVQMPDDLTNFRVRAIAASGWQRFGLSETTMKVRLPVLVQPRLPRFVRQGDVFWGGGIGRVVEGPAGAAAMEIALEGPADGTGLRQSVELESNRAETFVVPLTVRATSAVDPTSLAVKVGIRRKVDGVGDAFEVKLPVLPDRRVERFAYVEDFKPGPIKLRAFPEAPRAGTAQQTVVVTNVPGVLELVSAIESLGTSTYQSLEQRVSKIQPAIAHGAFVARFDVTGYGAKAVSIAKVLLADLPGYQDELGFFGYWPGTPGEVRLTAQVLGFLQAARKQGLAVDGKVEARAVQALQSVLRSDWAGLWPNWKYVQRTDALEALALANQLDTHYALELYEARRWLDAGTHADLASVMSRQPALFSSNLDVMRKELWDSVILKLNRGRTYFEGVKWGRTDWSGGYLTSQTSTVAAVFEGLVRLTPADTRLPLVRDGLLSRADPVRGWGASYENLRAIDALSTYLDEASVPTITTRVGFDGQKVLELDGTHKLATLRLSSEKVLEGMNAGVTAGARVSYTYVPDDPGWKVAARRDGLIVSRSSTVIPADGTAPREIADKAGAELRVAQGDVLEIHTQLVNDSERWHVELVVPLAAGFEPLNPELATSGAEARPSRADTLTPTYVQRLDHEVRYAFTRLPAGSYSFHFRVKATTEGTFTEPPPSAEQVYFPDVRGRGDGQKVVVTGAHQR